MYVIQLLSSTFASASAICCFMRSECWIISEFASSSSALACLNSRRMCFRCCTSDWNVWKVFHHSLTFVTDVPLDELMLWAVSVDTLLPPLISNVRVCSSGGFSLWKVSRSSRIWVNVGAGGGGDGACDLLNILSGILDQGCVCYYPFPFGCIQNS